MLEQLKAKAEAARLRAGAMWREHKERVAEKRDAKQRREVAGAPSQELIDGLGFASWIAYFALMYFLWERVLDVSQAQHSSLEITHFGVWSNLDLAVFFPLIIGYVFVVIGVPFVAKIAIPTLVSLNWREHFWPKLTALFITVLVSVVLITGTATVGSNAIIESERGAAVAVEQVQQNRAVLESRIARAESELDQMMNHRNTYMALAASMSPEEWQRSYIDARADDPQIDRFRSAIGASRDAQRKRDELNTLRDHLAASGTVAAVSSEVATARTQTLNSIMDVLNTFWVLMLAVVMDITCLFLPWIRMRLQQKRAAMMGVDASGWADEAHRIEDLRAEAPVEVRTDADGKVVMDRPREKMFDAETGEELVQRRGTWAKKPKRKGRAEQINIGPELPPEEAPGDGGRKHVQTTLAGVPDVSDSGGAVVKEPLEVHAEQNTETQHNEQVVHEPSEPPPMSDEDVLAAFAQEPQEQGSLADEKADAEAEQVEADHTALPNEDEPEQPRAPETREDRLIAAE